jgi:hypothetical protein
VFEVTKEGEVVWEFFSPHLKGKERAALYRVKRFYDSEEYPFLKKVMGGR